MVGTFDTLGTPEGATVGAREGKELGTVEKMLEGKELGTILGMELVVGSPVGGRLRVGVKVGVIVGKTVGSSVVGEKVGIIIIKYCLGQDYSSF